MTGEPCTGSGDDAKASSRQPLSHPLCLVAMPQPSFQVERQHPRTNCRETLVAAMRLYVQKPVRMWKSNPPLRSFLPKPYPPSSTPAPSAAQKRMVRQNLRGAKFGAGHLATGGNFVLRNIVCCRSVGDAPSGSGKIADCHRRHRIGFASTSCRPGRRPRDQPAAAGVPDPSSAALRT